MLIHAGFVKTGTTTLQIALFSRHPGLYSVGFPHKTEVQRQLGEELRSIPGVECDDGRLSTLAAESLLDRSPEKLAVLSDETLTANPQLILAMARRLKALFPEADLLFTIRHQLRGLCSFYGRHGRVLLNVPRPYKDRYVKFQDWLSYVYENRRSSTLQVFDYCRTIQIYEELFGRERIHVLLFEELHEEPEAFAEQLAEVLSLEPGPVRKLLQNERLHRQETVRYVLWDRSSKRLPVLKRVRVFRHISILQQMAEAFLAGGRPMKQPMPPEWVARIEDLYRPGNAVLAETYQLPLARYGYPM